jgi:hypothetical protein
MRREAKRLAAVGKLRALEHAEARLNDGRVAHLRNKRVHLQ